MYSTHLFLHAAARVALAGALATSATLALSDALDTTGYGDPDCGTVVMNSDGTYESAYSWAYGGVQLPDYGAFAECYEGPAQVCAIVCDLTGTGYPLGTYVDLYVWDDNQGVPGAVIAQRGHVYVPVYAAWPNTYRITWQFPEPVCATGKYWIGEWPDWPWQLPIWYVGADLNGPGGCPMTNIAPGQGYPSGWQDVAVRFGPTAAMGLGAQVLDCPPPTPTNETTWGRVKALMR